MKKRDGKRWVTAGGAALASMVLGLSAGCGGGSDAAGETEEGRDDRRNRVVTVETAPVEAREWQLVARAVGTLAADEKVRVRNEAAGMVRAIEASEGAEVKQGDALLRIDEERAALEVKRAEARHDEMQANVNRRRPLFEEELISEEELIQSESNFKAAEAELGLARRRLADTTVRAPIEGVLGRRYISRGDYVEVGSLLFDLVKIDLLKLDFSLPESYLPLLKEGQQVRVRTAAWPEKEFEGEIYFVDPLIDIATRTIPVRARIDNEHRRLRPNLFVNVEVDVMLIEDALVVPEETILSDLGGYQLYVVDAEDRAEIRTVKLGEREAGWIQIVEGVEEGERVVTAGHQRLQPGLRVSERGRDGE